VFGFGFGEMVVIAIVLLVAIGPKRLPTFMKSVGKGLREFRRATREIKDSVGFDQLMEDEDLRELRRPIRLAPPRPVPGRQPASPPGSPPAVGSAPTPPASVAPPSAGAAPDPGGVCPGSTSESRSPKDEP
jgi:Tat protein translocase TatB subunit